MQISTFREHEQLIINILKDQVRNQSRTTPSPARRHVLKETLVRLKSNRKLRRRCFLCYDRLVRSNNRQYAQKMVKQVTTYCSTCPGEPFMCLPCFQDQTSMNLEVIILSKDLFCVLDLLFSFISFLYCSITQKINKISK